MRRNRASSGPYSTGSMPSILLSTWRKLRLTNAVAAAVPSAVHISAGQSNLLCDRRRFTQVYRLANRLWLSLSGSEESLATDERVRIGMRQPRVAR